MLVLFFWGIKTMTAENGKLRVTEIEVLAGKAWFPLLGMTEVACKPKDMEIHVSDDGTLEACILTDDTTMYFEAYEWRLR